MMKRYLKNTSGQGMSEYLILVLLIAVGSIAAAKTLGTSVTSRLNDIHTQLDSLQVSGSGGHG